MALGRRLYRILPEDAFDRGPVVGGGGRFVLVADVRLDAREELAAELAITPERARTLSDTALLMAAFERWDTGCVSHLVGVFAFALWDIALQRLILARDFLGQRPLHYHRGAGFFAFASMPKGLHANPAIPYVLDEERIAEYIALMPEHGSASFFQGIERVGAGCCVTVTASGLTSERYWNPQRRTIKLKGPEEYAEALRHHLDVATRSALRGAGATVGAHLSAGFDSAAVAATAARLMAPGGGKVVAFTSVPREGYDGPAPHNRLGDEGPLAAATAALYPNMEHVLVRTPGATPLDRLDKDFFLYDAPVLNPCNGVWIGAINSRAQARGLNVVLSGQMGNMTISWAGQERLAELVREGRALTWLREARALRARRTMRWRGIAVASFGPWVPRALWVRLNDWHNGGGAAIDTYTAINAERLAALDLETKANERGLDFSYRPRYDAFDTRLWVLRRVDQGNYNTGMLAGWGIDQRDPTADRRLVEFALSVPSEQHIQNGELRALAKRALSDRVPAAVLQHGPKGYQAVDWHEGLTAARPQLRDEVERLEANVPAGRALDVARMRRLVDEWPEEGVNWNSQAIMQRYRLALLRGIAVGHFVRRVTGGNM